MLKADMKKRDILRYTGDFSQLFGVREIILGNGSAKGMRAFEINNGAGLSLTVLADRALDIASLAWRGDNLSYISRAGLVAPQYYQAEDFGFLRSFTAGFLTTCGLRNVGPACEDQGESFGLHGRIAHVPAEDVRAAVVWHDERPFIEIAGQMREARLFGEHLVLSRMITIPCGENRLMIDDTVENLGFSAEALQLLYHFNLGYPLLDESAELWLPERRTVPRDAAAEPSLADCCRFQPPTAGFEEQAFHHDLAVAGQNQTLAALVNPPRNLGVAIRFNKAQLKNLTEWKMMGEGEYVVGIEPSNNFVRGRSASRAAGELEWLMPGEARQINLTIEIISGPEPLLSLREEINGMRGL